MSGTPGKLNLFAILRGGDRRSIGRVPEVVAAVCADPNRFGELFRGIMAVDPVQAIAELSDQAPSPRPLVVRGLGYLTETAPPTMRSRGPRLLQGLERPRPSKRR